MRRRPEPQSIAWRPTSPSRSQRRCIATSTTSPRRSSTGSSTAGASMPRSSSTCERSPWSRRSRSSARFVALPSRRRPEARHDRRHRRRLTRADRVHQDVHALEGTIMVEDLKRLKGSYRSQAWQEIKSEGPLAYLALPLLILMAITHIAEHGWQAPLLSTQGAVYDVGDRHENQQRHREIGEWPFPLDLLPRLGPIAALQALQVFHHDRTLQCVHILMHPICPR